MVELEYFLGEHLLCGCEYNRVEITDGYCHGEFANTLDFVVDGKEYRVIEDPGDGYRSSMEEIIELEPYTVKNTFNCIKVVGVKKESSDYDKNDTIELIDCITGLNVVEFGTDNYDDYYPMFIASFYPQNMCINQENRNEQE